MIKLKEILCDIVKNTYGTNCNPQYYKFYVEISDKNYKSKNGHYEHTTHKIVIFNTYRNDEHIIKTTIHELAHHIDFCNRGTTDHHPPFYEEYTKLLYTSLDMRLFNKENFIDSQIDSSDHFKVCAILEEYEPHYIEYKQDKYIVCVYNSFIYKDYLRNQGYTYNGNLKCWEKEVSNKDEEIEKLNNLTGVEIKCTRATDLHFNGNIKLLAQGNTYTYREELKKAGFRYSNKQWIYYASSRENILLIKEIFKDNNELQFKQTK